MNREKINQILRNYYNIGPYESIYELEKLGIHIDIKKRNKGVEYNGMWRKNQKER